jgi:hypothetical protein
MNRQAVESVAKFLGVSPNQVKRCEEWSSVLFVVAFGSRPRFVSKKAVQRVKLLVSCNDIAQALIAQGATEEDLAEVKDWYEMKSKVEPAFFMRKPVAEVVDWIVEGKNFFQDYDRLKAESRVLVAVKDAVGIPSESDLEDAYQWVDTSLTGSEKQVSWAKDIAFKHLEAIARTWKQGKDVPTSAKWWIDNRNNIVVNLPL